MSWFLFLLTVATANEKLAVLQTETVDVDPQNAATFNEVISTEAANTGLYDVISARDVQATVGHTITQQQLGCDDSACFAEIGGALDAGLLLVSRVSMMDDVYVVSLKLISVETMQTTKRIYRKVRASMDGLLGTLRASVYELMELEAPAKLEIYTQDDGSLKGRVREANNAGG